MIPVVLLPVAAAAAPTVGKVLIVGMLSTNPIVSTVATAAATHVVAPVAQGLVVRAGYEVGKRVITNRKVIRGAITTFKSGKDALFKDDNSK